MNCPKCGALIDKMDIYEGQNICHCCYETFPANKQFPTKKQFQNVCNKFVKKIINEMNEMYNEFDYALLKMVKGNFKYFVSDCKSPKWDKTKRIYTAETTHRGTNDMSNAYSYIDLDMIRNKLVEAGIDYRIVTLEQLNAILKDRG